jgi:(p)ppGpp synthase/HD superfamily hydrolase
MSDDILKKAADNLRLNLKNGSPKFFEPVRDETGKIVGIKIPKENFENLTPRMRFLMFLHTVPPYKISFSMTKKARQYAVKCHKETNHKYDGREYFVHLQMVVDVANQFIHLIPEYDREPVLSACWIHDVMEDCRQTYNDVKKEIGEQVAEIGYALTNEKGKTRKERANDKYYKGIRKTPFATFVKLCDRIANVRYSKEKKSKMMEAYFNENPDFVDKLYCDEYSEMFDYLNNLVRS